MRLAGAQVGDAALGQAVLALEEHVEVLEEVHALEHHVLRTGTTSFQFSRPGLVHRGRHEAEVAARVVGADVEVVAVVVDLVLLLGDAGGHGAPLALGDGARGGSAPRRW